MSQLRFYRALAGLALVSALASCVLTACGSRSTRSGATSSQSPRIRDNGTAVTAPSASAAPLLPADLSLLTVVTKDRSLGTAYKPPDLIPISAEYQSSKEVQELRRPAAEALTQMLGDARRAGLTIKVNSGFRSYDYQAAVLRSEIANYGCVEALRQVAVPGHSEHQLGLAADLTSADVGWDLQDTFGTTPEGRWLVAHAASYGFVLSYPQDKEAITGYRYEPWHFRFVTVPVAQAIASSGKTPTEYLSGLGKASDTLAQSSGPPSSAGGCP
jgi:D-alanyl-D-alanine carboxypeptidase